MFKNDKVFLLGDNFFLLNDVGLKNKIKKIKRCGNKIVELKL